MSRSCPDFHDRRVRTATTARGWNEAAPTCAAYTTATKGTLLSTTDLTTATFADTIRDNDIVLLDFWASWCGPCRQFAPTYDKASETHSDVVFGKIDTEVEQQLAASANITSIPTLMAFREGVLVFSQPGALPPKGLEDVITAVKGLDMDEVRAEIAKQQAQGTTQA